MPYLCIKKCKFDSHIWNEGDFYDGNLTEIPKHFKEVGIETKPAPKKPTAKGTAK